jgi:hypothetical protein
MFVTTLGRPAPPRSRRGPTLLCLLLAGACQPSGAGDVSEDPLPRVAQGDEVDNTSRPPQRDYIRVIDTLELLPAGEGADLDGNGTPDNALGILSGAFRQGMAESLGAGWTMLLLGLTVPADPLLPGSPDAGLRLYWALDGDDPPTPDNNLTGNGLFRIASPDLAVSCRASTWPQDTADGATHRWYCAPATWKTLDLSDLRIEFALSEDAAHVSARAEGVYSLCGLATTLFPGTQSGTLLDALGSTASPDMDRDGDGLERIEGIGTPLLRCIDGDGTVIEGTHCACDARLADGYSAAFAASAITATILSGTSSQ